MILNGNINYFSQINLHVLELKNNIYIAIKFNIIENTFLIVKKILNKVKIKKLLSVYFSKKLIVCVGISATSLLTTNFTTLCSSIPRVKTKAKP